MIWLLGGMTALAVLLLAPAAPIALKARAARRAAALRQQEEQQRQREQEETEVRRKAEQIWDDNPGLAVFGEYPQFEARVQTPRQQVADEAQRELGAADEAIGRHLTAFPGGTLPKATYQALLLLALAVYPLLFLLGTWLDFMIFRALHPTSVLLPAALAAIAMTGITVGSVLAFGAVRHGLLPESMSDYARGVTRLFGALLAVGLVGYMAVIAPMRSELSWQPAITTDQQAVQAAQFAVDTATSASQRQVLEDNLTAASTTLTDDENSRSRAETVDRLSALALGAVDIPLVELAVLGGEVLILRVLLRRREGARKAHQAAVDAVALANAQFIAQLVAQLTAHGKDQEAVREGLARVRELSVILGTAFAPEAVEGSLPPALGRPGDSGDDGKHGGASGPASAAPTRLDPPGTRAIPPAPDTDVPLPRPLPTGQAPPAPAPPATARPTPARPAPTPAQTPTPAPAQTPAPAPAPPSPPGIGVPGSAAKLPDSQLDETA